MFNFKIAVRLPAYLENIL